MSSEIAENCRNGQRKAIFKKHVGTQAENERKYEVEKPVMKWRAHTGAHTDFEVRGRAILDAHGAVPAAPGGVVGARHRSEALGRGQAMADDERHQFGLHLVLFNNTAQN